MASPRLTRAGRFGDPAARPLARYDRADPMLAGFGELGEVRTRVQLAGAVPVLDHVFRDAGLLRTCLAPRGGRRPLRPTSARGGAGRGDTVTRCSRLSRPRQLPPEAEG